MTAKWWAAPLIVLVVALAIPVGLVLFVLYGVLSTVLHLAIWAWWCGRGRDILFVHSDSPVWREYIAQHVLPHLQQRAIMLNWSERSRWRFSLARLACRHFGGDSEFNPMAVVFRPLRRTRTFRFWRAFRDWKHGRPEALQAVEREFFEAARIGPGTPRLRHG